MLHPVAIMHISVLPLATDFLAMFPIFLVVIIRQQSIFSGLCSIVVCKHNFLFPGPAKECGSYLLPPPSAHAHFAISLLPGRTDRYIHSTPMVEAFC